MYKSVFSHHNQAPSNTKGGQEDPWPNLVSDDSRRRLENGVRDEED
jgi:hypothetical protein